MRIALFHVAAGALVALSAGALSACSRATVATRGDAATHDGAGVGDAAILDAAIPDTARPHDAHDAHVVTVDSGRVPHGHVDVLTQHNDTSRSGQNLSETILNTSNVNASSFGRLFTVPADGLIYAQPLIVTDYPVSDDDGAVSNRDILVVATMHNSVYAYDANTGDLLWHRGPLGPSVPNTEIGPIINDAGQHQGTQNIQVEVGILSTPVIDRESGTIYLTRKDYTNGVQSYKLHVLSLATGQDEPGSPTTISARAQGTVGYDANDAGVITMDPGFVAQRPGLLLFHGNVYLAFASHEDFQPYHGWIVAYAYDASKQSLTQTAVWNVTPDGHEGGIWNGGQGLITDGTSIYALTSNGTVSASMPGGSSYGEAFVKLSPDLEVQDWFTPVNYGTLNQGDIDLGSGGPVLIPGTSPPLIVGAGKEGIMYVADTTDMGKLGTTDDKNTQEFFLAPPPKPGVGSMYGSPVVWTGTGTPYLYTWASGDYVRKLTLKNGLFVTSDTGDGGVVTSAHANGGEPVVNVVVPAQDPVGNLAVSSNGGATGTGILWGCNPKSNPDHATVGGTFYAFDATTLDVLWSDVETSTVGFYAKFVPPTVANGKVYLATHAHEVIVYGLQDAGP